MIHEIDHTMIELLDEKVRNIKENIKEFHNEQSEFQTKFNEQNRTVREINNRLAQLEEQKDEFDFSDLQTKDPLKVADVMQVLKDMQADILSKTVTRNDMSSILQQINDIESMNDELMKKQHKWITMQEQIEQLTLLPQKVK